MSKQGHAAGILLLLFLTCPLAAQAACTDLLPARKEGEGEKRAVSAEDLIAMRDIGFPDVAAAPAESPLAVSPDGQRLAFVIVRADAKSNGYCRGLAVLEVGSGEQPRLLDSGGDFIPLVAASRGLLVNTGAAAVVTPAWSPDGRALAYRKRVDGRTEAWIAAADGSGARRAGRLDVDVEAVAWSADGLRLIVASRPGYAEQALARDREGASGFLYDDRFQPNDDSKPALLAETRIAIEAVDLSNGSIVPADDRDRSRLPPRFIGAQPATLSATSLSGRRVWLAPTFDGLAAPMRLHSDDGDGRKRPCMAEACLGSIRALFWVGDSVVFLRREGWANGTNALYRWRPGDERPSRLLSTTDELYGCSALEVDLACLAENAAMPRRLVRVDVADGRRRTLFDPNPEFRRIRLGEVRRLPVRNAFGLEAWADLVLPAGYRGGRLPTVVVQYFSRGFLRGGGGDEYPVHASAARGVAVLSIQRPLPMSTLDPKADTALSANAADLKGWAERRSLLDVIEKAVSEAVRLGVADPSCLGITGQSDGATSTVFAILNSRRFKAASVTGSALEPGTTMIYGGPRWAEFNRAIGYPELGRDDPDFWRPMSLGRGGLRANVPLLIQAADREYLLSLEAWTRLKQAGYPVEMYVFPNEFHNKWQPRHRAAAYTRNLDWFAFWLSGRRDPDPDKAAQYSRWDDLKRLRDAKPFAAGPLGEP